jgi:hypothetical protein
MASIRTLLTKSAANTSDKRPKEKPLWVCAFHRDKVIKGM